MMKIFLRDRNLPLVQSWTKIFAGNPDVSISYGDIFGEGEHLNAEAIISPANSFGYMDGGIDFVYSDYFGWAISDLLRTKIWTEFNGELLVGQATIIDMRDTTPRDAKLQERVGRMPYLISAPTMRVPMGVANTVNAYLAFKAALFEAKKKGIKSVLCPGLATSIGKLPPEVCACQMYEAYTHFDKPRFFDVLGNAHAFHYSMLNPELYLENKDASCGWN